MEINHQKRSITPEKAIALLSKEGMAISLAEAETVVAFLYFLAEIVVDENLADENS